MRILFECGEQIPLKEMTCKNSSLAHHKRCKTAAFCEFKKSKFFMRNLLEFRQQTVLKELACERRSWVNHKM